jgi:hypothetical protein
MSSMAQDDVLGLLGCALADPAAPQLARPACADILQRRVLGLFETMMQNGREQRIPEQDMIDAKFALAAFADEIIYHSTWPGKTQWLSNPLQLQFFGINTAGDGFFVNLDNLHGQRGRNHVAQIYFSVPRARLPGQIPPAQPGGPAAVVEGLGNYVARSKRVGETCSRRTPSAKTAAAARCGASCPISRSRSGSSCWRCSW